MCSVRGLGSERANSRRIFGFGVLGENSNEKLDSQSLKKETPKNPSDSVKDDQTRETKDKRSTVP